MNTTIIKVRITLTEPALGIACADPDIHGKYIAAHAPDAKTMEQEIETIGVEEMHAKATTVWPRLPDGRPFYYDYQIKGSFKDSCGLLARAPSSLSSGLKAYRKTIDGLVFPRPRNIPLTLPDGASITIRQRPIRISDAAGERVALASSEEVPAGTTFEYEVLLLNEKLEPLLVEWLDYGALRGYGQWRNSGAGRFTWERLK